MSRIVEYVRVSKTVSSKVCTIEADLSFMLSVFKSVFHGLRADISRDEKIMQTMIYPCT